MTYKKFRSQEKYVYYNPVFNEFILGNAGKRKVWIYIAGKKFFALSYVGEL
jgi:hypothetical protein